jgi:hypothetical protein
VDVSPDGGLLVTTGEIWDLRQLRPQLAQIHSDWDRPPYPPSSTSAAARPLQIRVDLGKGPG